MSVWFDRPWVLALLILSVLPLLLSGQRPNSVATVGTVPADLVSALIGQGLRIAGMLAMACLVIGAARPYRPGEKIDRMGEGAQIVLLLDRSGSMNDTFAGQTPQGGEESKASATRRLLGKFVGSRPHDLFGAVAFSTAPILVLPLTDHKDAVQGAINATDRRGLDFTNIARGLAMALSLFTERGSNEHRVILLVSDGGAVIEGRVQDQLRAEFSRIGTDLFFLFLRTAGSKGLFDKPAPGEDTPQSMPERYLHIFFQSLHANYQAFQVENPQQVEEAIQKIDRLERHPIAYSEEEPRRDLTNWAYLAAILAILVLILARLCETRLRRPRRSGGQAMQRIP
ncbi:VWA domain-containing protein [Labrys sp. WJW]|uniref:vWA domain-containing protein n=1 Tax=Labrys sp. WJW TaxID=1737983 RepID=UPI00082D833D|nr:vWA domain-containing protein [Labrys sp. WJW]OCC05475.1 VWA domain-containing protein [Labrys sp. WJW]